MPRYAARTDKNHAEVMGWFRELGCSVLDLSKVGGNCPDLLVGFGHRDRLVEVKCPGQRPSARKLRPGQLQFFDTWRGLRPAKVETQDDVLAVWKQLREAG